MNKIEKLREKVRKLYESKELNRDDWADWLYENHVFIVANKAKELAERFNVDNDLPEASGMLHDIGDAVMDRFDKFHEEKSLEIAKKFLGESGFGEKEIKIVIDALLFHGCHNDKEPNTIEGKIMATADAVAHLSGNYYERSIKAMKERGDPKEKITEWASSKIERDFHKKIYFDDIREKVRADYEKLKTRMVSNSAAIND